MLDEGIDAEACNTHGVEGRVGSEEVVMQLTEVYLMPPFKALKRQLAFG